MKRFVPFFYGLLICVSLIGIVSCENALVDQIRTQVDEFHQSRGPQITLEYNGSTVSSGSTITVTGTNLGSSVDIIFVIKSSGESSLLLFEDPEVLDPESDFSLNSGPSEYSVLPGESQSFTIRFDPQSTGVKSAQLSISSNAADFPLFQITVEAEATPEPVSDIEVRDKVGWSLIPGDLSVAYSFGNVAVDSDLSRVFTIRNLGSIDLALTGGTLVSITGIDASQFVVTSNPSGTVVPGGSTEMTIRFLPVSRGDKSAKVSILSNDADENPYEFNVTGTGIEADISVSGTTSFGNVYADGNNGTASSYATHTIRNDGNITLTISSIALSGGNSGDFDLSLPALPAQISAGGTRTFSVRFDPLAIGTRSSNISIGSDDPDENPYTYGVSGTGTQPEIAVSGSGAFGNVIQKTTKDLSFTISNSGTYNLILSGSPYVTLSGSADFSVVSQPTGTIAPGASSSFTVRFTPSSIGAKNATVSIANNDSNENPYTISLSGTGEYFHGKKTIYTGTIGMSDIATIGNNTIYISFYDALGDDLELMESSDGGSTFYQTTLSSTGDQGWTHGLSLDYYSDPYIACYDRTSGDLELNYLSSWWKNTTLDSTGDVGGHCSIDTYATSSTEIHYIAYNDASNGSLKVANVNSEGQLTGSLHVVDDPATASVGQFASIAVDNANVNRVYVAYYDYTNKNLKFSTSSNGASTWSTPITIDSTGDVGSSTSIECIGSTVYITYRDLSNSQIKMVKSTNNGTSWGTPTVIASSSTYPGNIVVGSTLYLAYASGGIRLARSTNGGSSWTHTLVDSGGIGSPALSVYGSNVTITYMDSNSDLRIARSLDSGNTWD